MRGNRKKALISGAGIAGPALAWWLDRFGIDSTIVEIAPQLRSGGYMIDFWGIGFDLIERMELLPELLRKGYHVQEVRLVHADGSRAGGFSTAAFERATDGRFISLPRSALAKMIWDALPPVVGTRFGDQVSRIETAGENVRVDFEHSPSATFDLVIGADGAHSRVRELLFGPEERFETFLGYAFAAFTVEGYEPRTPDIYMTYGVPGRQASRFTMRDNLTLMLFIWREESSQLPASDEGKRALLRDRFRAMGWECGAMLASLDQANDLYLDAVSQIHLPDWSAGRVALVGDAAWAPSFLAGEGTGLGILGAYVLAGELARSGGHPAAFGAYERRLRPLIEAKQKAAAKFGGAFAPETPFGVFLRNWISRLLNLRPIANLALGSFLKDDIDLPDYVRET